MITRQFIGKKTINEDGTVKAVITTDTPDRYDEIVKPKGALLDNYRKNPVVLWNHNPNILPVGRNINIAVYENEIVALTKFNDTILGKDCDILYKNGDLNAFSIGFIPHKKDVDEKGRTIYTEWELLEYSCVPIPANPSAVSMALKNIQSPELKSMLLEYERKNMEQVQTKEFENKFTEINDKIEDLELSYDNISNDLVKIEENAILVEKALEEFEAIKTENAKLKDSIAYLTDLINGKVKIYDKDVIKSLIKELVTLEMNKIVKKIK